MNWIKQVVGVPDNGSSVPSPGAGLPQAAGAAVAPLGRADAAELRAGPRAVRAHAAPQALRHALPLHRLLLQAGKNCKGMRARNACSISGLPFCLMLFTGAQRFVDRTSSSC